MKRVMFLTALLATGCVTAGVYTAEDFSEYQERHKTVAVLPFDVSITLKKLPEGLTQEDLRAQEQDEAYELQRQMYTQFLQRYAKDYYTVEFQDIDTTNVLLNRGDIGYQDLGSHTKGELAGILGVDAVISGSISRSQPMGTGAAIASTILLGFGQTNQVNCTLTIHDAETGSLLWSFDHKVVGGLGSTPEKMAETWLKSIAKEFPYDKEVDEG